MRCAASSKRWNSRRSGPQEYLLIKPLAPDAGGEFAEQAAGHVRALDDLGLVVRLGL